MPSIVSISSTIVVSGFMPMPSSPRTVVSLLHEGITNQTATVNKMDTGRKVFFNRYMNLFFDKKTIEKLDN